MKRLLARACLAASLLLMAGNAAIADTEIRTVVVEGRGATREAAMVDGFAEALRQVNGVKVDLSRELTGVFSESAEQSGKGTTKTTTVSSVQSERVRTASKGAIRSYSIDSIGRDPGGEWSVHLRAEVASYRPPPNASRRRKIVVLPFGTIDTSFPYANGRLSATTVRDDLLNAVNRNFIHSRKFDVLSREDSGALKGERDLITEESPVEEIAKLGQTLGADYLVCGSIRGFSITGDNRYSPPELLGATITVDFRIVMVATAQMKWADSVFLTLDDDALDACGGNTQTAYRHLIADAGRGIVSSVLENIYPIAVLSINGIGELVLDQGAGLVQPGDLYDVFQLGDELIGRNGESLGREETRIASIRIVRSDPKLSYGRVVTGKDDGKEAKETTITKELVATGLVVRPFREPNGTPKEKPRKPIPKRKVEQPSSTPAQQTGVKVKFPSQPFSVGLVPPVQTCDDVSNISGVDFGLLWACHHDVEGFAFGSIGHQARGSMLGWQLSSLYNESHGYSAGFQLTGGVNYSQGAFDGMEISGLANIVLGDVQGAQITGLANVTENFSGLQIAVANISADVDGVQIGVYNQGVRVSGVQIGAVNVAKSLCGVQIGVGNYIEDSPVPFLPVINASF